MLKLANPAVSGLDLAGADAHISDESFHTEVAHFVALKGFCIVSTGIPSSVLTEAQAEARSLDDEGRFYAPPTMVVEGLLGAEASATIAELDPFICDQTERSEGEHLQQLDDFMADAAGNIDDIIEPTFGFTCGERSAGMLHMGRTYEAEPIELTEKIAGKWMHLFRRGRLMFVMCLGSKGGSLMLRPFDADSAQFTVGLKFGQMAILRADYLSHTYVGNTEKDLLLSCWILQNDRLGPRGAFAEGRDSMPLVPAAQNLVEWANQRLMMIRANREEMEGTLADQDIPRNWKLFASHSVHQGVQAAIRGVALNMPHRCETMASTGGPLTHGADFGIQVPFRRWDHFHEGPNMGGWYDPQPDIWRHTRWRTNIKHATFIEGHELFDSKFFNVSALESKVMDPNQRLSLESCYESLHMSGYTKKQLMQSFIGVYCGHTASDWDKIEHEQAGGCAGSYSPTINSNRVSFSLGMMGPSFTIDVEAASSLAATYQGAHDVVPTGDLRKPPLLAATCSGSTLNLSSYWWPVHNQFMSIAGRCLTFDQSASGYIKGEGVCSVVLKRHGEVVEGQVVLDQSMPNIGLLVGWSMINSGANAGLVSPSGPSLQKVVADTVRIAQISPLDVDAVEPHGSGQYVNDATEVSSLAKSIRGLPGGADEILMINSSKGKLGFTQETSGMSSLEGILVCQRLGIVSPCVHLKTLNPYIAIDDFAAFTPTENVSYRASSSFHGVMSYGIGGTNVGAMLLTDLNSDLFDTPKIELDHQVFAFWPGGGGQLMDQLKSARGYMITGSWLQWKDPEKMTREKDGSYSFVLTLGPNRFEHFQILVGEDEGMALYPGEKNAASATAMYGPSPISECQGLSWLIDGRSKLVALPFQRQMEFIPHSGALATSGDIMEKKCTLEEAKSECEKLPLCKGFCYRGEPDVEGMVTVIFNTKLQVQDRIGWTSYFVEEKSADKTLEYYKVSGRDAGIPGDQYKIKLQIAGKWQTVTWDKIASNERPTAISDTGDYYVIASWSDWGVTLMQKDPSRRGVFTLDVVLPGSRYSPFIKGQFQIVRNQDINQAFFPADKASADCQANNVAGPDEASEMGWRLEGEPGQTYTIEFERRIELDGEVKKVSWQRKKAALTM